MKRFKLLSCNRKTQFSDLPSCLVIDILSRLPIATLVTCICVCKDWIRLFRDPTFIRLQLAASPVHILNRHAIKEIFHFGQVMEDYKVKILNLNLPAKGNSLKLRHHADRFAFKCISSSNGLMCLVDRNSCGSKPFSTRICVFVCNPILGEWVSISTPVRGSHDVTNMALVFSPKNNQYKLLYCFDSKQDCGFQIYTLGGGTRQWRNIDETLGCRPWRGTFYHQDFTSSFFPGLLHWVVYPKHNDFICCFDIDNEKFRKLPLPSPNLESSKITCVQLGTIHGCLCALFSFEYSNKTFHLEIWSMKEYGVEKSWGMMLTFSMSFTNRVCHALMLPFLFSLNEEEIVMHDYKDGLLTYNLRSKMFRPGPTYRQNTLYPPLFLGYKPSFISLQDVAKGEHLILSRTMQLIQ